MNKHNMSDSEDFQANWNEYIAHAQAYLITYSQAYTPLENLLGMQLNKLLM